MERWETWSIFWVQAAKKLWALVVVCEREDMSFSLRGYVCVAGDSRWHALHFCEDIRGAESLAWASSGFVLGNEVRETEQDSGGNFADDCGTPLSEFDCASAQRLGKDDLLRPRHAEPRGSKAKSSPGDLRLSNTRAGDSGRYQDLLTSLPLHI